MGRNKQCNKCKEYLPLTEYWKDPHQKDGLCYSCKTCRRSYYKKNYQRVCRKSFLKNKDRYNQWYYGYRKTKEDGLFHVYILPEENYCGQTKNLFFREVEHRSIHKRNTKGMYVVASVKTRKEALEIEYQYHQKGYEGKSWGNKYQNRYA